MKRYLSITMTLVLLFSTFMLTVYAQTIPEMSQNIKFGETVSHEVENIYQYGDHVYAVKVKEKGRLTATLQFETWNEYPGSDARMGVCLYNSKVDLVVPIDAKSTRGAITDYKLEMDKASSKPAGTFTYDVDKGTYYIALSESFGVGVFEMTATFSAASQNNNNSSDSSKNDINTSNDPIMTVTIKEGGSLQLGAALPVSNKTTQKWTTSKKSVATVNNSGYVRAIEKGAATIKVTAGDTKLQIRVIVE